MAPKSEAAVAAKVNPQGRPRFRLELGRVFIASPQKRCVPPRSKAKPQSPWEYPAVVRRAARPMSVPWSMNVQAFAAKPKTSGPVGAEPNPASSCSAMGLTASTPLSSSRFAAPPPTKIQEETSACAAGAALTTVRRATRGKRRSRVTHGAVTERGDHLKSSVSVAVVGSALVFERRSGQRPPAVRLAESRSNTAVTCSGETGPRSRSTAPPSRFKNTNVGT